MKWLGSVIAAAALCVAAPAVASANSEPGKNVTLTYAGPRLGVQVLPLTEELRQHMGASKDAGLLIGKVEPGSAADKAGLKVGDVMVSVANKPVADVNDVRRALSSYKEGDLIAVQVVRDRRPVVLSATVPKPEPVPLSTGEPGFGPPESFFSLPGFDRGQAMRFFSSGELEQRLDAIEQRLQKLEEAQKH